MLWYIYFSLGIGWEPFFVHTGCRGRSGKSVVHMHTCSQCPPIAGCLAECGSLSDCRCISVRSILWLPLFLLIQKFAFENVFSRKYLHVLFPSVFLMGSWERRDKGRQSSVCTLKWKYILHISMECLPWWRTLLYFYEQNKSGL